MTFKKGADSHPENHETYNLDTEDGREIAEIHLKTLLVTCKSQWNGALSKHQEVNKCYYSSRNLPVQLTILLIGRFGFEGR